MLMRVLKELNGKIKCICPCLSPVLDIVFAIAEVCRGGDAGCVGGESEFALKRHSVKG